MWINIFKNCSLQTNNETPDLGLNDLIRRNIFCILISSNIKILRFHAHKHKIILFIYDGRYVYNVYESLRMHFPAYMDLLNLS